MKNELLKISLSAAVPIWIDELKRRSLAYVQERAAICGQHVAEHGDVILFKSKKRNATSDAFNRLAEGVACLAFSPGGVTIFEMHFEAQHPEAVSPTQ